MRNPNKKASTREDSRLVQNASSNQPIIVVKINPVEKATRKLANQRTFENQRLPKNPTKIPPSIRVTPTRYGYSWASSSRGSVTGQPAACFTLIVVWQSMEFTLRIVASPCLVIEESQRMETDNERVSYGFSVHL